jgi:FtsH-binding integral membrane protein
MYVWCWLRAFQSTCINVNYICLVVFTRRMHNKAFLTITVYKQYTLVEGLLTTLCVQEYTARYITSVYLHRVRLYGLLLTLKVSVLCVYCVLACTWTRYRHPYVIHVLYYVVVLLWYYRRPTRYAERYCHRTLYGLMFPDVPYTYTYPSYTPTCTSYVSGCSCLHFMQYT